MSVPRTDRYFPLTKFTLPSWPITAHATGRPKLLSDSQIHLLTIRGQCGVKGELLCAPEQGFGPGQLSLLPLCQRL